MKIFSVFIIVLVLFISNLSAQDSLKIQKEKPFVTVEQMPSFPGGESELYKFIGENFRHPVLLREEGICTRITARFVVEADGSISNIQLIKGCGEESQKSIMEMIQKMPKWTPGKQNGKNVAVYYTLSINLHIK
jgi:protein TonB